MQFFKRFIDAMRACPLTLEVLETEHEQWGEEASRTLGGSDFEARPWLQGMTLLLVGGVQYLAMRSRKIRIFGGLNIQSDAGWNELKASVRALAHTLMPHDRPRN